MRRWGRAAYGQNAALPNTAFETNSNPFYVATLMTPRPLFRPHKPPPTNLLADRPFHSITNRPLKQLEAMELEILRTVVVRPSLDHHPTVLLPLSHIDADRNLNFFFRTIRLYPAAPAGCPTSGDFADAFAAALSSTLTLYFPFAATLHCRSPDSRLELRYDPHPERGVLLSVASASLTLAEFNAAAPDSPLLHRLAPHPIPEGNESAGRLLALQLTRLRCGGLALGMCVHHSLCDGAGATQFLSAVAGFVRGQPQPPIEPVWKRSELLGPRSPARVELQLPLFEEILEFDDDVALSSPYNVVTKSMDGPLIRECFHVNEACLDRFRKRLAEQAGSSITTFEALSSFVWRSRVKGAEVSGDEVVKLVYPMNVSKVLTPPLPAGYWGNVCVPVYVALGAGELVEQPLPDTAKLIKASKRGVTDEYVRSYVDFQELHYSKGIWAGGRVSAFTDWRHLGHSDVDFGWGGPASVAPLSWRLLGSMGVCFFLPYGAGDQRKKEGFKVLISASEKEMAALRVDMQMFAN